MHRRLGIGFLVAAIGASVAVLVAQTPDPGRRGVWTSGPAGQAAGSDGIFNTLTVTSTAADSVDMAGGLTAGSGSVAIIDTSGKIPALSATYLASLSGAALTSLDAGNISAGTLVVGRGGTGATTLTDGGVLLGSGTGAVTALAALADGAIVIGDGSGDPTTLDVGSSTAITVLGTVATGTWQATDVGVAYGGTGVSTLTDGGVLLGSGSGFVGWWWPRARAGKLVIEMAGARVADSSAAAVPENLLSLHANRIPFVVPDARFQKKNSNQFVQFQSIRSNHFQSIRSMEINSNQFVPVKFQLCLSNADHSNFYLSSPTFQLLPSFSHQLRNINSNFKNQVPVNTHLFRKKTR